MPECYIRGSTIKYLRIPDEVIDMVKDEIVLKSRGRGEMKGRGGQRGGPRGGRGESLIQHGPSHFSIGSSTPKKEMIQRYFCRKDLSLFDLCCLMTA